MKEQFANSDSAMFRRQIRVEQRQMASGRSQESRDGIEAGLMMMKLTPSSGQKDLIKTTNWIPLCQLTTAGPEHDRTHETEPPTCSAGRPSGACRVGAEQAEFSRLGSSEAFWKDERRVRYGVRVTR
ncbi:unnamed protein product [Protopolystoma xenopodis]|uniref:Uncharacterized protein n=1 Tax=Protopolystoma xenopodis TaxID=117903 RepID=A0A3S5FE12_9PLAT|nr:unnamed protein product [Protopolystoma xenopodis]